MLSYKKINITSLLIFLFIFASVVLDPGDNMMRLIKVLFVIPCFFYLVTSQKVYFDTYTRWMICFVAIAGLSFFWALSISNAAYRYQTLVLNFICIYCLLVYCRNRADRINLILKTILFAPIFLEVRVVMSYGLLAFADTRSVMGIMSPNAIGMRAGIAAVLGAYFLMTEKRHRVIYLIGTALNVAIVVLSASRKAILFVVIPLLLYYIFRRGKIMRILISSMFAIILVSVTYYGIINIPFMYGIVGYRIETMIYGILDIGKTDGSTSFRLMMIDWGWEWFKSKPWIGYGINNYMTLLGTMGTSYGTTGVYAHNNYIELLVDLGLIGTAIYYFIYLKMIVKAFNSRKELTKLQLIMVCIFASIVVNEYGMVTYIDIYAQIVLLLTWLLLFIGDKINGKETAYGMEQSS